MRYEIEFMDEQRIAYIRRVGAYGAENYDLMEELKVWIGENELWSEDTTIYGIARDNPELIGVENCRYDVGVVVGDDYRNDEIDFEYIDEGKYVTFIVEHTEEAVANFWSSSGESLSELNYIFDESRLILERYKNSLIQKGYCEFCVPIL